MAKEITEIPNEMTEIVTTEISNEMTQIITTEIPNEMAEKMIQETPNQVDNKMITEVTKEITNKKSIRRAFQAAFPYTIPIFAGFWFLSLAYGILMNVNGFSFLYPMFMSMLIYGGSLEFLTVSMLMSSFSPIATLTVALLVQARHLFYGISMLDLYKGTGWKKPYLIFGMCDESFSINYSAQIPEDVDRGWFMFFVTLLNQLYWVSGATAGGLLGSVLHFNTQGLDFVMTAMFVVIFMEQWKKEEKKYTGLIGIGASLIALLLFGPDSFLVPAMILILALLTIFRKPISSSYLESIANDYPDNSTKDHSDDSSMNCSGDSNKICSDNITENCPDVCESTILKGGTKS